MRHSLAEAVLEALELFRDLDGSISLNSIVAFLTLCERDDLTLKELAFATRMADSTLSRALRTFEAPDSESAQPPCLGLVQITRGVADGRNRIARLTDKGARFRAQIETAVSAKLSA